MTERLASYYLARGFIEAEDRVLDLYCENGFGTAILADRAFYILGVDYDITGPASRFAVSGFMEFAEIVPQAKFEVVVAFRGVWKKDLKNITRRLITNREINSKGWTEVYRFDCPTPIIIYDRI